MSSGGGIARGRYEVAECVLTVAEGMAGEVRGDTIVGAPNA